jgi:hypothetical protein
MYRAATNGCGPVWPATAATTASLSDYSDCRMTQKRTRHLRRVSLGRKLQTKLIRGASLYRNSHTLFEKHGIPRDGKLVEVPGYLAAAILYLRSS